MNTYALNRVRSQRIKKNAHRIQAPAISVWGFERMSREEAVLRVKKLLGRSPKNHSAYQLMGLFNIQPEELTEVGVSYELVKSLERCYQF